MLIVGLGNPGEAYRHSRHNVGFRVLEALAREALAEWVRGEFQSKHARVVLNAGRFILLCPQTFMNLSGRAVKVAAERFGFSTGQILVVHDDLDLPVGRIKMVRKGGPGGHKGVESIIETLGSSAFPRVKVGIGRPRYGETVENYVLGPFYEDELEVMEQVVLCGVHACEWFLLKGIEAAMNWTNCQNLAIKEEKS